MLRREEGQAMVEMALVLPILLLLLLGIVEFGRVFNAFITVNHVSREGARAAALGNNDAEITALVLDRTEGLEKARLVVKTTPTLTERSRGTGVTVEVNYSVPLIAPIIASVLPNPFPVAAQTTMRVE